MTNSKQTLNKEAWIKRFKSTHGDRYDYSKFAYVNSHTKIEIICRIHGSFFQNPNNHKNSQGCPACQSIFNQPGREKLSILIEEGGRIHGNRYSYDRAIYLGAMETTTITCELHGDFLQTPQSHVVSKNGCPECAKLKRSATRIYNAGKAFPVKARERHGHRYDYSEVQYTGAHDDVTIICEEHGPFTQMATNHLQGKGCQKCKGGVAIKLGDWLEQANNVHGQKFDYSKVTFSSVTHLVRIGCSDHGEFKQRAFLHLKSLEPCPECRPSKPWTIERFLSSAEAIHNNYYTYVNLPAVIDYNTPIEAICPEHGKWTIPSAGGHASESKPSGCPSCGIGKGGAARQITIEKVLEAFKNNHGDKYDPAKVKFSKVDAPIEFTCPEHGSVSLRTANLFIGDGCFHCREIKLTESRRLATDAFVSACLETHGNYYDYSDTIYRNVFSPIWVKCPKHGFFKQVAVTHREGSGCSACASHGFDPLAPCIFYYVKINRINEEPLWMIGITKNSFERRYTQAERSFMELIKIIYFETGSEALLYETSLKRKYQSRRFHGTSPLNVKLNSELFVENIFGK